MSAYHRSTGGWSYGDASPASAGRSSAHRTRHSESWAGYAPVYDDDGHDASAHGYRVTDLRKNVVRRIAWDASFDKVLWDTVRPVMAAWSELEEDWDGDGASAPSRAALDSAEDFVVRCEAAGVAEPRPYIASDGEFGFHWDGEVEASLSFLPEGRFVGYCERRDRAPVRIAGPLDIAAASAELFAALAALRGA